MTFNFRAKIDFSNSKKIRILAHRFILARKIQIFLNSEIFLNELYLVTFRVR